MKFTDSDIRVYYDRPTGNIHLIMDPTSAHRLEKKLSSPSIMFGGTNIDSSTRVGTIAEKLRLILGWIT